MLGPRGTIRFCGEDAKFLLMPPARLHRGKLREHSGSSLDFCTHASSPSDFPPPIQPVHLRVFEGR